MRSSPSRAPRSAPGRTGVAGSILCGMSSCTLSCLTICTAWPRFLGVILPRAGPSTSLASPATAAATRRSARAASRSRLRCVRASATSGSRCPTVAATPARCMLSLRFILPTPRRRCRRGPRRVRGSRVLLPPRATTGRRRCTPAHRVPFRLCTRRRMRRAPLHPARGAAPPCGESRSCHSGAFRTGTHPCRRTSSPIRSPTCLRGTARTLPPRAMRCTAHSRHQRRPRRTPRTSRSWTGACSPPAGGGRSHRRPPTPRCRATRTSRWTACICSALWPLLHP